MLGSLLVYTALTLLVITVSYIYLYVKKRRVYWKNKNVPYAKSLPIIGNYWGYILLQKYIGNILQELCQKFPNAPYFGVFFGTEPVMVAQDPEIIKIIMTKDFNFFNSRELATYSDREMLTKNLFGDYGDKWKLFRKNLTPLFSTAKMKNMFYLIENRSHIYEKILDQETKTSDAIDVTYLSARFTLDCICSCAFGVNTKTMEEKENNPFRAIGESIFKTAYLHACKDVLRNMWPDIFYALGLKIFPKQHEEFFHNLLTGVFKGRQYKSTTKNDFVDLLLKLKEKQDISSDSSDVIVFDDNMLVAQLFLFFVAGFDTSAVTSSFTLYELAKSPQVQEKVFEEVNEYLRRHDNVLEYECLTEMPYLEACMDEALRLYPVLGTLTREVTEDYVLPDGVKLETGLRIHIPLYHIQRNPEYFPEPEQYRPERFLGEAKRDIKPYTYMPFGEGPRICLGMRFAKMQVLAGLITVLKKYRLELAPGMKREVKLEPKSFVTHPIGGIQIRFIEREGWRDRIFMSSKSKIPS